MNDELSLLIFGKLIKLPEVEKGDEQIELCYENQFREIKKIAISYYIDGDLAPFDEITGDIEGFIGQAIIKISAGDNDYGVKLVLHSKNDSIAFWWYRRKTNEGFLVSEIDN